MLRVFELKIKIKKISMKEVHCIELLQWWTHWDHLLVDIGTVYILTLSLEHLMSLMLLQSNLGPIKSFVGLMFFVLYMH